MKKTMSVLLLLLTVAILLGSFASCGNETSTPATTTASEEEAVYLDDLANYGLDYENAEFSVLNVNDAEGDYRYTTFDISDEEAESNANVLDFAIYTRNREIEERFNIIFTSAYDYYWNCNTTLSTLVQSDLHDYDMVMLVNRDAYSAAIQDWLLPVSKMTYVDQTKDYYLHDINNAMTLNGKQFLCYSEESLYTFGRTTCMVFNKKIADAYGISESEIYDLVDSGTWTFEELFKYMELATDVGEDGVNCYGLYGHIDYTVSTFLNCANVDYITKTDTSLKFDFSNEKAGNIIQTILEKVEKNEFGYETDYQTKANSCYDVFKNGQALFAGTVAGKLSMFLDVDSLEYGVLPWPKYDTEQTNYRSRVVDAWLHVIPVNVSDPDRASAMVEALASGTSSLVFEAFYERQLKLRSTKDENSYNAMELIRETRAMDWGGTVFDQTIRSCVETDLFAKKSGLSYSTYCRSNLAGVVNNLISEAVEASKK